MCRSSAARRRSSARCSACSGGVFARPIVVSSAASQFLVADQADEIGAEIEIALEPEGRDTLAAVTLAACLAARRDPGAIVLVMPSDHLVPDVQAFEEAAKAAARLASEGRIVVLGHHADRGLDRLWLHRQGRADRPERACGGAVRREARCRTRCRADRRGLPVERRDVLLPGRRRGSRDRGARAAGDPGGAAVDRRRHRRSRGAAARRGLRHGAEDQLRSRGDGADDAGRGAGDRLRVVGHRRLEGGVGAQPARRARRGARGQGL